MRMASTQDLAAPGAAAGPDFRHVRVWLFDLDNTLYPHGSELLAEAERRICLFIQRHIGLDEGEAWRLQKECLRDAGSTLAGLVRRFAIDPESYFAFVNDVDVTTLAPDPKLRAGLARLPGKRFVFTNNCARYAERVLGRLGITEMFDGICDIRAARFAAKPARGAYDAAITCSGAVPARAAMFDDAARNLLPAHALGMTTVWLRPPGGAAGAPHIHHETQDLGEFLHVIEVASTP